MDGSVAILGIKKSRLVWILHDKVALLKAGCQKFVQEFKDISQFDPDEKCISIASACNRYWRKCHLSPETVAVEPPRGWKGARVNQSRVALEWLLWCEHQLPSSSCDIPRIQRVRNDGEQRVSEHTPDILLSVKLHPTCSKQSILFSN